MTGVAGSAGSKPAGNWCLGEQRGNVRARRAETDRTEEATFLASVCAHPLLVSSADLGLKLALLGASWPRITYRDPDLPPYLADPQI